MSFADTVGYLFKEEIDSTGQSFKTVCPACDSTAWSMDKDSGIGSCFSCGAGRGEKGGGSFAAWLTRHWQAALAATKADEYLELQKLRRIPADIFCRAMIAKSPFVAGEWWLPTTPHFKRTGIKVLRSQKLSDGSWKKRWKRLAGLSDENAAGTSFLYQPMMAVAKSPGEVYLTEGEWDALALWHLLEKNGEKKFNVVGSPGASSFNAEYARFFKGKPVVIVGQRDEAGQRFVEESASQLFTFVPSVASFDWTAFGETPELNEKRSKRDWSEVKDVNDVLWAAPKDTGVFADTAAHTPIKTFGERRAKIKRESLEEIYADLGSYLELTDSHKKMLRVMLAVFLSSKFKGTPIWLFVHGPSGCGKTEILETLKKHENNFEVSRVTRASLVSGRSGEDDPSLLPRLDMMNLAIKDYTVLLNMSPAELDGVNSIFRDIFDGSGVFGFGGQERSYRDLYFSTIACCTDAILKRNDTTLGERFLMLDALDREKIDVRSLVAAAVDAEDRGEAKFTLKHLTQQGVAYFVDYLWKLYPDGPPAIPQAYKDRVIDISMIVTKLRAVVPSADEDDHRFREEYGTRCGKTLRRLLAFLTMVYQLREPNEKCWDDLRSVARSSMNGWSFDICESIYLSKKEGMTRTEIAKRIVTTPENVGRRLAKLRTVGAVYSKGMRSTARTREKCWFLDPEFHSYWKGACITTKNSRPSDLYRKRVLKTTPSESRPERHLKLADTPSTSKRRRA